MNSSDTMSDIGFDPLAWLREEPPAAVAPPIKMTPPPSESPPPPAALTAAPVVAAAALPQSPPAELSGPQTIHLAGRLEVASVADLKREMERALRNGSVVLLNGSGVERADGAALQLLLAFWRESEAVGMTVAWQSPSAALLNAAAVIGIAASLHL